MSVKENYEISSEVYCGPFDILLKQILENNLSIWEISLKDIVDNFVNYLESQERNIDINTKTEFLTIAAILIQLKAKKMIPQSNDIDYDDDLFRFENRDVLLARLLECKTYKDVAQVFKENIEKSRGIYLRLIGPEKKYLLTEYDKLEYTDPALLTKALISCLSKKVDSKLSLTHITPITVTIKECIDQIWKLINKHEKSKISFENLTKWCPTKVHIIASFLALLELYKQDFIDIDQPYNVDDASLGELMVTTNSEQNSDEFETFIENFREEKSVVTI